jgi:hypothetical protein
MRALIFMAGVAAGVAIAFRLRRTTEGRCCERVAKAVREKVGTEVCGVAGGLCQNIGDALNLWEHSPDLLDVFGVD